MSTFTRALTRLAAAFTTKPSSTVTTRMGTVTSVTAGTSLDGRATATVTIRGSALMAPYLSSYTPAANDVVMVLLVDNSPIILGRIFGLPSF